MNYSLALLATQDDCLAMIGLANKEKNALTLRKMNLEKQYQSASTTTVNIENTLVLINSELAFLQTMFDGLPEGPNKEDVEAKIKKNQYKKFTLELRRANYKVVSLLEKECEIGTLEKSISETENFIEQVTAHMDEI